MELQISQWVGWVFCAAVLRLGPQLHESTDSFGGCRAAGLTVTNDKEQFSATALADTHSSHYFLQKQACFRMMKGKNSLGQDCQSFLYTDYCNVLACVRQDEGTIQGRI